MIWKHPILWLTYGFVIGGAAVAVVLTRFFGVELPAVSLPTSIDSGWGSLFGALFSGVIAVSLFLWQRRVDIRATNRKAMGSLVLTLTLCISKLSKLDEQMKHQMVAEGLEKWQASERFSYLAANWEEMSYVFASMKVVIESSLPDLEEANQILTRLSDNIEAYEHFSEWVELQTNLTIVIRGLSEIHEAITKEESPRRPPHEAASFISNQASLFLSAVNLVNEYRKSLEAIKQSTHKLM